MDYQVWKDSDNRYILLCDMSADYINACIRQLERVIKAFRLDTKHPCERSNNPADNNVLHLNWSIDHAQNYLNAFIAELESRG